LAHDTHGPLSIRRWSCLGRPSRGRSRMSIRETWRPTAAPAPQFGYLLLWGLVVAPTCCRPWCVSCPANWAGYRKIAAQAIGRQMGRPCAAAFWRRPSSVAIATDLRNTGGAIALQVRHLPLSVSAGTPVWLVCLCASRGQGSSVVVIRRADHRYLIILLSGFFSPPVSCRHSGSLCRHFAPLLLSPLLTPFHFSPHFSVRRPTV